MENNLSLTIGFKGQAVINGQPMFNKNGIWTIGGYIDSSETQTAYFGRAVSIVTGTDPYSFLMGFPASSTFAGILINEQQFQENSPAKPNYLLATEPATAIYFGHFWLESFTTTVGISTPTATSKVIASNTTGQIEFLASATVIPSGWTQVNARVITYNSGINGVLIFMGQSISDYEQNFMFQSDTTHAINFQDTTIGTNTDGSLISTGATWLSTATAGGTMVKLLCDSTATSGDFATERIRARSSGVNAAGGVIAGNYSASANINDYANLYAVQGYASPNAFTQANASNIVCGVYSCVQRTTTSSGRSWSLWTDTQETVKATGGHYLHRLSHNGGAINLDGIWSIYAGQGCDYLFNFENTNAPIVTRDSDGGTATYSIKCYVNGAVRYLQLYDAA